MNSLYLYKGKCVWDMSAQEPVIFMDKMGTMGPERFLTLHGTYKFTNGQDSTNFGDFNNPSTSMPVFLSVTEGKEASMRHFGLKLLNFTAYLVSKKLLTIEPFDTEESEGY